MILITGASGSVGKAVLQEAIRKASKVRAMYRSKEEAAKAPSGCEARLADYADKRSLSKALDGVTSVFVVCSPIPQLVELESNVLDVCKESGVKHVVLNSALGAGDYPKSFPGWHRKVEDKLKATAMSCTILRPNGFLQNIVTYNAPSIRSQGAFYVAMGDAKVSYLDIGDIAAVAVKALQGGAHAGKTYELHGPEAISNQELAKRISRVAGRTVNYVDIPEFAQRDQADIDELICVAAVVAKQVQAPIDPDDEQVEIAVAVDVDAGDLPCTGASQSCRQQGAAVCEPALRLVVQQRQSRPAREDPGRIRSSIPAVSRSRTHRASWRAVCLPAT